MESTLHLMFVRNLRNYWRHLQTDIINFILLMYYKLKFVIIKVNRVSQSIVEIFLKKKMGN